MARFSRSWRLLQLLFPGAFETGTPADLLSGIQPVWDALRLHVGECLMQSETLTSSPSPGGDVTMNFREPERGRIFVPLSLCAYKADVAILRVESWMNLTASSPDAWGAFGNTMLHEVVIDATVATSVDRRAMPTLPFIPRGNNAQVIFRATTAGSTLQAAMNWMNCPGEIVSTLPFPVLGSP